MHLHDVVFGSSGGGLTSSDLGLLQDQSSCAGVQVKVVFYWQLQTQSLEMRTGNTVTWA